MRVLLVTQYFYPENFKSNDIAFELSSRGYEVDALVGIPNYPEGKYYKGHGVFRKRHEVLNGVNIYRCFQTPRGGRSSAIGLFLNYITFVISAIFWIIFYFAWKKKYDAIITHEPSPITQIIPAIILGKIRRIPVYSWILDIWPDSMLSAVGEQKGKFFRGILTSITEWVYRNSKLIMVSSKGMMPLVNRNNDYSSKLVYFPNWCDDILKLPKEPSLELPGGFKIMMAGNLNTGIGVDDVINLVDSLKNKDQLWFIFVGGGSKEQYLRETFDSKGIKNVVMTGRLPFSKMAALYDQADAMLLTLRSTPYLHLKATVPARLQSYMSAGKPILGMIDGDAQAVINDADCGYCANAGDYKALSEYICNTVLACPEDFMDKGRNARTYFEKYYLKEGCIANLDYYMSNTDIEGRPYNVPEV